MLLKRGKQKPGMIAALALCIAVAALGLFMFQKNSASKLKQADRTHPGKVSTPAESQKVTGKIKKSEPIVFQDLKKDETLKTMMGHRKEKHGIKKSLDMIVQSDESFTVGKSTVSMQKILEQAFKKKGQVFEEQILDSGTTRPVKTQTYGIYVVQPGDNIWNIHFRILKDYYTDKGLIIKEGADEPGTGGMSSGVGKILKFSETMVIIYNLHEEKVTQDINILEPLSKVVVYNMDAVFALLEQINFDNVNRIQFDGKNIWIPVKKS
ncbi:MAG: hypothetical protein HUK40_21815 [Desulfobacter sp.]|nr:hypothetical protein [Desulfobacter sp.]